MVDQNKEYFGKISLGKLKTFDSHDGEDLLWAFAHQGVGPITFSDMENITKANGRGIRCPKLSDGEGSVMKVAEEVKYSGFDKDGASGGPRDDGDSKVCVTETFNDGVGAAANNVTSCLIRVC